MKALSIYIAMNAVALLAAGCASVPLSTHDGSDARAVELLHQAANAEGSNALLRLAAVDVRYHGEWGADIVAKVQPVLVDKQFRGNSKERYAVADRSVEQYHTGPGGQKYVKRTPTTTRVAYNNIDNADSDVQDAAALVADGYRMFLFGPAFFLERHAVVQSLGTSSVDDMDCDDLLAVLRPGIGNSVEDRVIVSIDRGKHFVRRVRMTVEGMQSTKGAVADVYLRNPIRIAGVVFPTVFDEELKSPFDVNVHHWQITDIDLEKSSPGH